MRNIFLGIVALFFAMPGYSQQRVLTLRDALDTAFKNYPLNAQKDLVKKLGKQNEELITDRFLPQVNLTGQASYQSEVTKFNMPGISGIPGQKPDQYRLGTELRYPLTNFSELKTEKELEVAKTDLSANQIDVDLQKLGERVTNIFANILLQKKNKEILLNRRRDIEVQLKKIESAVANGTVLKSNKLVFESEILLSDQRIDDIESAVLGLVSELNILTGLQAESTTDFQLNLTVAADTNNINRPEFRVFKSQEKVFDLQKILQKKQDRPSLYFFGQGNYGRPGYNFLNNDMRLYGIAGVALNWNLNNLVTGSKREKIIDINKQIVNRQREIFQMNLQASLRSKEIEINKYPVIIEKDRQIVEKRSQILKVLSSQLENGAVTSTEYLTELNAANAAQLNMVLHQLQLQIAKNQYNTLLGN